MQFNQGHFSLYEGQEHSRREIASEKYLAKNAALNAYHHEMEKNETVSPLVMFGFAAGMFAMVFYFQDQLPAAIEFVADFLRTFGIG